MLDGGPSTTRIDEAASTLSLTSADIQDLELSLNDSAVTISFAFTPFVAETALFGIFSLLIILSMLVLLRNGLRPRSKLVVLLVTVAMYAAATTQWALQLTYLSKLMNHAAASQTATGSCLEELQAKGMCTDQAYPTIPDLELIIDGRAHRCTPTALLAINIVLGDGIVLWRAILLWTKGRAVRGVSLVLIFVTVVMAILNTNDACTRDDHGELFAGDGYGLAAFLFSWLTNIWATGLISFRAWNHRLFVREHIKGGDMLSLAEKIMVLFIESGVLYSILWTFLMASKIGDLLEPDDIENFGPRATNNLSHSLGGITVQLMGIYPTIVVILVGLEKSRWNTSPSLLTDPSINCETALIKRGEGASPLAERRYPPVFEPAESPGGALEWYQAHGTRL